MNKIISLLLVLMVCCNCKTNAQLTYKFVPDSLKVNVNQVASFSFPVCQAPALLWATTPYSVEFSTDNGAT